MFCKDSPIIDRSTPDFYNLL